MIKGNISSSANFKNLVAEEPVLNESECYTFHSGQQLWKCEQSSIGETPGMYLVYVSTPYILATASAYLMKVSYECLKHAMDILNSLGMWKVGT